MRRRQFIAGLGSAAAWPMVARAQQPAVRVIGYLSGRTADSDASMLVAFRRGLGDVGYAEGRNVAIEYRFTDGRYDLLSTQLTGLTQRKVGVIVFPGAVPIEELVQQVHASPIPIVMTAGFDPVRAGLVASINRAALFGPGISWENNIIRDARDAAAVLGQKLLVLEASTGEEIDAQFARLDQEPADAMLVAASPFFLTRAGQITALAASHRVPAVYIRREFAEAGGLMSYGFNVADNFRWLGRYAGRILNGEKPADLPIIQATKFELVINLKAAKALNLEIPPLVLALADEVIQ